MRTLAGLIRRPRVRLTAALVLVSLFGGACAGEGRGMAGADGNAGGTGRSTTTLLPGAGSQGTPNFEAAYTAIRGAYADLYRTGDVIAGGIATQKGFADTANKAADIRIALARLLGEHTLLAAVAMTKSLGGGPDFKAVVGALDKNSVELGAVIGSLYGKDAQNQFLKPWRAHLRTLLTYTTAAAQRDEETKQRSARERDRFAASFGSFLGETTGLAPQIVTDALKKHATLLTGAVDDAAATRYDDAYAGIAEAHKHSVETGSLLARGIAKQKDLGDPDSQEAQTRISVDSVLGEHAALVALLLTKGFEAAPDLAAVVRSLDQNSVELGVVIGAFYGPEVQTELVAQWRDHIRMLVDYTAATAKDDKGQRDKAVAELSAFNSSFSQLLATTTGLPADTVRAPLKTHLGQLTKALDRYAGTA